MRGRCSFTRQGDGQALIQVAVLMILIMGFIALAIDVGHFLSLRRQMQNAADAGALAGAKAICDEGSPFGGTTGQSADAAAIEYAIANGADQSMTTVDLSGNNVVAVNAGMQATTFFGGLIGVETTDIYAEASATCGAAVSACTLFPVGFQASEFDKYVGTCQGGNGMSASFWIFDGEQAVDCLQYNCDFNGDGRDDVVSGSQRAWLDFAKAIDDRYPDTCSDGRPNCDTPELVCRVGKDHNAEVIIPSCIAGTPGSRETLFTPAGSSPLKQREGDTVRVPLYDGYCGDGKATGSCQSGLYNVTRFGCVKIIKVTKNFMVRAKVPGVLPRVKHYDVIEAQAHCAGCPTNCGRTLGGPPAFGELRGVRLIQ